MLFLWAPNLWESSEKSSWGWWRWGVSGERQQENLSLFPKASFGFQFIVRLSRRWCLWHWTQLKSVSARSFCTRAGRADREFVASQASHPHLSGLHRHFTFFQFSPLSFLLRSLWPPWHPSRVHLLADALLPSTLWWKCRRPDVFHLRQQGLRAWQLSGHCLETVQTNWVLEEDSSGHRVAAESAACPGVARGA